MLEIGYYLLRRKVIEVMVWVLMNKDRNFFLEILCFFFIVYGFKDNRLLVKEMRDVINYVLEKCYEKGIDVVGFYIDG